MFHIQHQTPGGTLYTEGSNPTAYFERRSLDHSWIFLPDGFDACRIVPLLKAGQFGSAHAIPGMTGLLSIDESGHVKRELDWAKVSGGRAVPLGTVATAATN